MMTSLLQEMMQGQVVKKDQAAASSALPLHLLCTSTAPFPRILACSLGDLGPDLPPCFFACPVQIIKLFFIKVQDISIQIATDSVD